MNKKKKKTNLVRFLHIEEWILEFVKKHKPPEQTEDNKV